MTSGTRTGAERARLFLVGVLALFTAGLGAALRAAVANDIRLELLEPFDPQRSAELIGQALGSAFLGFAITLSVVSPLLDALGMRRVLIAAALAFVGGTLLTIFAADLGAGSAAYSCVRLGMLLSGVGWGCVEASINPMTTALYPDDKIHRLNVLHAWWPGGLIAGGLIGMFSAAVHLSWQVALGLMIVPAVAFGYLACGATFPATERAQAGVSFADMFRETLRRPSFFIWFGAMFLTAASELAPGRWVDIALSHTVGMRGILLLVYVSALMFVFRHFAGPLAHRLSSVGLLWCSSLLAAVGLYLLSSANSPVTGILAATIWGAGVCFMWPTMLASVAERYPRGGAWMIGLMGSAGALSIFFVLPELGAIFDRVKIEATGGSSQMAALTAEQTREVMAIAARESFRTVALVPLALLVVFGALWLFERRRRVAAQTGIAQA